jgi:hypothetical protein
VSEFERIAESRKRTGVFREFWQFLSHSKKWWLLPIIAVLFLFGLLILLSGTAVAPFIYTIF